MFLLLLPLLVLHSMRGILSEAMVMCAFTTDPETSQFIDPPPDSVIGERIKFEGYEGVLYIAEIHVQYLNFWRTEFP